MKILPLYFIVALGLLLTGCAQEVVPEQAKTVVPVKSQGDTVAPAGKPDMKVMFGADYKKGDIGHSIGVLMAIKNDGAMLTIEHGTVHGTSVEANTTDFALLGDLDVSTLSETNRVEFLVKRGGDDVYRLLKICDLGPTSAKCL